jgi:hypothetical protein
MADELRQGPATFAIEASQPVQSAAVPQASPYANAQAAPIAPGITTQAPGVDDINGKTFRAIADLASGLLAPKIKEAAQAQFITGVQRAMTGEALGEIIKDQPWYTDIFAPSSALAGARTYTAQAAVAQWAGKIQEQMPLLAKQSPEDLRSAAVGALQGFMTGDASTDAQITAATVEHMAPLFKQQAKEHYVYVQKQASMAQIGSWEAQAQVFQGFAASAASGKGTVSPDDLAAAKQRLLGSIAPFADQSDESYQRNIRAFIEGSASKGNFQVVRLLKDSDLYSKIDPEKRADLDRTLHVFGKETLAKAMPQFAVDVATLVNDTTQNPKDIAEKVLALNARAAAVTGVTEADLIPLSSIDNIVGHVMTAQQRAAAAAAKGPKQQDDTVDISRSQIMLAPGAVDQCVKIGLCKEADVEKAGIDLWNQAGDAAAKARVLNARTLAPFDVVKSQFVNTMRSDEYQAGVGNMAQVYEGLADNVKPHYFDEHQRSLMDRFNAQVRAGMPPQAAWATAKANPSVTKYLFDGNAKDEASKAIRSVVEDANKTGVSFLSYNNVDDAGMRTIEAATMKVYKTDRTNNSPDIAAKRAYSQALANGLDIQGKHVVINASPKDRPLYSLINEGQKDTATAFEDLMAEKAKAFGVKLDNYEAIRAPDVGGVAHIYVNATDDHGKTQSWAITSQELKAQVAKHIQSHPVRTGLGPVDAILNKLDPATVPGSQRAVSGPVTDLSAP